MATIMNRKMPAVLLAVLLAINMMPGFAPSALAETTEDALQTPAMWASHTIARPGDVVTFSLAFSLQGLETPETLEVIDELPDGVVPTSVSVTDADGQDLTETAGQAIIQDQVATYSFNSEWLETALPEEGTLTVEFTTEVAELDTDNGDEQGRIIDNAATVTCDDLTATSNTVSVVVADVSEDTVAASSALRMFATSTPQTFRTKAVSTSDLFSGGYYLDSAGNVPVALTQDDIDYYNGGIEYSESGVFVIRDYTPAGTDGATNFWATAVYRNYGDLVNADTGERTPVDVKTTIIPRATCATGAVAEWNSIIGQQYNRNYAYVMFLSPGMGAAVANMPIFDQTWEFFKAGTTEPVTIDGELWVMQQSLDMGEGFSCQNVTASYATASMPNRNDQAGDQSLTSLIADSSRRSVVPGSNIYEFTQTNWADASDGTWSGLIGATIYTGLANGQDSFRWKEPGEDDTSQDLTALGLGSYKNTHLWASGSMKVAMNGSNTLTVRNYEVGTRNWPKDNPGSLESSGLEYDRSTGRYVDNTGTGYYGMKYYVMYFTTLTGFVPENPTKTVDKSSAWAGETLSYTVEQPIGAWGSDLGQGTTYERLEFTDSLPAGTTYVANSFKAYDTTGADVTSRGTFSVSGQDLAFSFDSDYLSGDLEYDGGNMKFAFKATIDADCAGGTTLQNKALDYVNGYDLESNPVTTTVLQDEYYSPVKAVDKAKAEVGETVTYTVTQKVHASADRPGGKAYSALVFTDTLPDGLTYKPGSFSIVDTQGVNLADEAEEYYYEPYGIDKVGTLNVSGQTLTYTFDRDFLSCLPYNGKDLTFTFSGTVDAKAAGTTLKNTATTTVNTTERTSNEVITEVPEVVVVPEPQTPVKSVDKEKASPGDPLTYTVKQPVGELPDGAWYAELSFYDELPDGAVPSTLTVQDPSGADVTSSAGVAKISGQVVTYTFDAAWLQNKLGNASGELTFVIAANIDSGNPARYGGKLVNNATLDFGDDVTRKTNDVVTLVEVEPVSLPLTGMAGIAGIVSLAGGALALGFAGLTLLRRRGGRGTR